MNARRSGTPGFLAERRKVANSKKSGAGVDSIYEPLLYYYKDMIFIEDYITAWESVLYLDEDFEVGTSRAVSPGKDISILEEGEFLTEKCSERLPTIDIIFLEDSPRVASAPPHANLGDTIDGTPPSRLAKRRRV